MTNEGCEDALNLTTTIRWELSTRILHIMGKPPHLDFVVNYLGILLAGSG